MRGNRKGRSGGALKRATPKMKYKYMQKYLSLKKTIAESQEQNDTCPKCTKPIGTRPLFMIGKYDICYDCYRENELLERDQPEIAEANTVSDRFNFATVKEVEF